MRQSSLEGSTSGGTRAEQPPLVHRGLSEGWWKSSWPGPWAGLALAHLLTESKFEPSV